MNICSYHLQEAGATPVQELAYALLDGDGRARCGEGQRRRSSPSEMPQVVGRISFFVNAGIRFVEEMCKMRAFVALWDEHHQGALRRHGRPSCRRFRYGVQVNSLGLTEQQPENNIIRIVLEMLAVTLSKNARARAIQLPAWNEALGLPRPWDQQWSLRAQQILAFESDLLELRRHLRRQHVIEARVSRDGRGRPSARSTTSLARGGAVEAVESGYIKQRLVESNARAARARSSAASRSWSA